MLYPTTVDVLATHESVTECTTGAVAVPFNATSVGEFGVLLVTVTLPESVPAADGANFTLTLVLAPAASVVGIASPLIVYPVPEITAWLIETAALPVLESVIVCEALLPVTTLPKFSVAGLAESCGCTPAPVADITPGEFVALLFTETVPFTAPTTVGANTTDSTVVCPAVSVIGVAIPFALNPAPTTATLEIVTFPVPEFVTVTVFVLLFPTFMFPNATLVGLTLSKFVCAAVTASVTVTDIGEFVTPAAVTIT
jgi:hypothetical protein